MESKIENHTGRSWGFFIAVVITGVAVGLIIPISIDFILADIGAPNLFFVPSAYNPYQRWLYMNVLIHGGQPWYLSLSRFVLNYAVAPALILAAINPSLDFSVIKRPKVWPRLSVSWIIAFYIPHFFIFLGDDSLYGNKYIILFVSPLIFSLLAILVSEYGLSGDFREKTFLQEPKLKKALTSWIKVFFVFLLFRILLWLLFGDFTKFHGFEFDLSPMVLSIRKVLLLGFLCVFSWTIGIMLILGLFSSGSRSQLKRAGRYYPFPPTTRSRPGRNSSYAQTKIEINRCFRIVPKLRFHKRIQNGFPLSRE